MHYGVTLNICLPAKYQHFNTPVIDATILGLVKNPSQYVVLNARHHIGINGKKTNENTRLYRIDRRFRCRHSLKYLYSLGLLREYVIIDPGRLDMPGCHYLRHYYNQKG